jgi:hypothetical protein
MRLLLWAALTAMGTVWWIGFFTVVGWVIP